MTDLARGGSDGRRSDVAGIVLAAGLSTRFDGNKLLAPLRGKPVIRWTVEAALASRLDRIVIVLGHESERVRAALAGVPSGDRLETVVNPNYGDGQSGSVIAGLDAVQESCNAAMFLMGDQPLLNSETIDALIAAYDASISDICYPSNDGQRRNPVIFAARYFPAILALTGDVGARALIDANPEAALAVDFPDKAQFKDVDSINDFVALADSKQ